MTLERLLYQLDYKLKDGCHRHSQRKVIFLGDFIDRGPFQKETIELVRPMVEQGQALAVMGNHEFNALAYHQADGRGGHLRRHTAKNQAQHRAFLDAYPPGSERDSTLEWFMTLPMFLELEDLRVVHAAWLPEMVAKVRQWAPRGLLTPTLLKQASEPETEPFIAIESLLKGWETPLPDGLTFKDKDGHTRTQMRTRWWEPWPQRLPEANLGPAVPDVPIGPPSHQLYSQLEKSVFVGHYWLQGEPRLWAKNVCCLDYSVAKAGKLAAYRWNGETPLSVDRFVSVERVESTKDHGNI